MTIEELERLRADPAITGFLDVLSRSEGTAGRGDNGYNVAFGGAPTVSYESHPRALSEFTQTDGKKNKTTAAGRYQIIAPTYDRLQKRLGLNDFSPRTQDLMALELIREKGALDDVQRGDYATAINKLGSVWASLPSSPYAQPKNTMQDLLGSAPTVTSRDGRRMFALPEDDREANYLSDIAGMPDSVQSMLTKALAKVTQARNSLEKEDSLFDDMPTMLDDELLDLIDRV